MQDGGGTGDDDDDESRCEYATLTCRRTAAGQTRVHVKVWFHDDRDGHDAQTTVLRAHVAVADTGDVYSGRVTRGEAAGANAAAAAADDPAAAVRRWLENARRALVGPRDGGDEEYVHCLDADADGAVATLAWKRKLRPIGAVALGSVRLCRDAVGACRAFVGPLVGRLSAERLRADRAERAAAEDARRLSADNARLLDALRSSADRRRLDDDRLTARFVRVLNAKKERLAAALRELQELRDGRRPGDDDSPTAVEPETARAGRRGGGGRRAARGRAGKRGSTAAGKRGRPQTTSRVWRPFSGLGGDDRTADDVDAVAATTRRAADEDSRRDTMQTDGRDADAVVATSADDADFDVFGADTQVDGDDDNDERHEKMETDDCGRGTDAVVEADPASVSRDHAAFDVCGADSQIDGDDPSSSPSFFHRVTSTQSAETDEPSPDRDVEPRNKSFLDDLWHGIL